MWGGEAPLSMGAWTCPTCGRGNAGNTDKCSTSGCPGTRPHRPGTGFLNNNVNWFNFGKDLMQHPVQTGKRLWNYYMKTKPNSMNEPGYQSGPGQQNCRGCGKYLGRMARVPSPDGQGYYHEQCAVNAGIPVQRHSFNLSEFKKTATLNPMELAREFISDFQNEDPEDFMENILDFLESCSERELSIIVQHKDRPDVLRQVRMTIQEDLNDTAKQLAME